MTPTPAHPTPPSPRHRLAVVTDLTSIEAAVREPDDGQSLVRLLAHANDVDLVALVAGSGLRHGHVCRPELAHRAIDAYATDLPNLRRHDTAYPDADALRSVVAAGQPIAGPDVPVDNSIGPGLSTPGSEILCKALLEPDPRPLWIAAWGGTADVAQALWTLRNDLPAADFATVLGRARLVSISRQDSTAAWLESTFPGLFIWLRTFGYRGMYRGGDTTWSDGAWVRRHVSGHGALGSLYPVYDGGDIWSRELGNVQGTKEGDTPSVLGFFRNGLNPDHTPQWGGWAGRASRDALRPEDDGDRLPPTQGDRHPSMNSVHRWRPAFQAEFATRLSWCLPDTPVTTPTIAAVDGDRSLAVVRTRATAGSTLTLDGRASSAHGGTPAIRWWIYHEAGRNSAGARIDHPSAPVARLHLEAPLAPGAEVHVILEVRGNGPLAPTRYRRIVVDVS